LGYPHGEIERLLKEVEEDHLHPRDLKEKLARELVETYHSKREADEESEEFLRIFREKEIPSDLKEKQITKQDVQILSKLLTSLELTTSNREANRLIQQGAVKINDKTENNPSRILEPGNYILKVGKRKFLKLIINH
jgi:tyrosyl-tRNA synthetase